MKKLRTHRLRPFTVMEMIVALGIFSSMLLIMMRFYSSAQAIWTTSEKRTAAYSNARIAFDLFDTAYRSSSPEGFEINDSDCIFFGKVPFTFFGKNKIDKDYSELDQQDRITFAQMRFFISDNTFCVTITPEDGSGRETVNLIPGITELKFSARWLGRKNGKLIYEDTPGALDRHQNVRPDEIIMELTAFDERILEIPGADPSDSTFKAQNGFSIVRLFSLPILPDGE